MLCKPSEVTPLAWGEIVRAGCEDLDAPEAPENLVATPITLGDEELALLEPITDQVTATGTSAFV